MTEKRAKRTAKRAPKRQDRARVAAATADATPIGGWGDVRHRYPEHIRRIVDAQVARGVSIADVAACARARYLMCEDLVEQAKREREAAHADPSADPDHEAPGLRSIQFLEATAARYLTIYADCVKHSSAPLDEGSSLVPVPEGLTRAELVKRVKREHEIIN